MLLWLLVPRLPLLLLPRLVLLLLPSDNGAGSAATDEPDASTYIGVAEGSGAAVTSTPPYTAPLGACHC